MGKDIMGLWAGLRQWSWLLAWDSISPMSSLSRPCPISATLLPSEELEDFHGCGRGAENKWFAHD